MARKPSKTEEIEALAAEIGKKPEPRPEPGPEPAPEPGPAAAASGGGTDAEALLSQLKSALEDGLSDTRDFTENHPLAALSAAFLLGLAVGRLWRSA